MPRFPLSIALAVASLLALGAPDRHAFAISPAVDPAAILHIEAVDREPGDTGTSHYTDELRFSAEGAAPLVLTTAMEIGRLAPIPGLKFGIGRDRVLLVGWSSTGGGMQTTHALLLRIEKKRVVLETQIASTTDRPSAGVVIRRDGPEKVLIGLPERPDTGHEPSDWSLVLGPEKRLTWDQLGQLPHSDFARRADDVSYFPPFFTGHTFRRVTWISASANGLAVVGASGLASVPMHAWQGERWLDTFPAYAGARLLCSQRVAGKPRDREFTAYATPNAVAAVAAFYTEYAWDLTIGHGPDGTQLYGPGEVELAIQPKTKFTLRCGAEPTNGDSTVVVVSQLIERKEP